MNLRNLLTRVLPNPDLVGRVMIRDEDVPPESRQTYDRKLAEAQEYIARRNITIPPAYGSSKQ